MYTFDIRCLQYLLKFKNSIWSTSLGSYLDAMSQSKPPSPPLNIPSGNSQITPDPEPLKPDETLSGDKFHDFKAALRVRQRPSTFYLSTLT